MSRHWSIFWIILASFLFLVASVGFWMRTTVLDEDNFVEIVVDTFESEEVRVTIGEGIVDTAFEDNPVIGDFVRGPASEIIAGILGAPIFEDAVDLMAHLFYKALVITSAEVTINLEPIKDLITQVVNVLAPEGSAAVDVDQIPDEIVLLDNSDVPSIQSIMTGVEWFTIIVGLISIGLFTLVLWKGWSTTNRDSYFKWIGGSLAIGAIILVLLTSAIGSSAALSIEDQAGRVLVSETYDNIVAQLRIQSIGLFVIGSGIWLIGWWMIRNERQEQSDDVEEVVVSDDPEDDLPATEAAATP